MHTQRMAWHVQMHYKTLCTTMTTLPGVTTPEQLLDASLRITAVKAAMAETKLDEAINSGGAQGNPMMSSLETCKESYASLVDSINTSGDTLKNGGSNADLMTELSAAATYSTDCEDTFEERPELQSPIPGAQRHISRLVSNCLDLAATIKEQP
jgi:pectinesterase inhibitor-like protein